MSEEQLSRARGDLVIVRFIIGIYQVTPNILPKSLVEIGSVKLYCVSYLFLIVIIYTIFKLVGELITW